MEITYLGWSGFVVRGGGRSASIDAFWGGLRSSPSAPPSDWARDLDAVALSHTHFDHCGSAAALLAREPRAVLVADGDVVEHPRLGADEARRCAGGWTGEGMRIELLRAVHLREPPLEQLTTGLRWAARRPVSMARMLGQIAAAPRGGATRVVRVLTEGRVVLHASEVLHDGTGPEQVRGWLRGRRLDVLLAGVEPGTQAGLLRGLDLLRPDRVVLFSPHRWTRRWFDGDDALDLASLADVIRALPFRPEAVELAPGDTLEVSEAAA